MMEGENLFKIMLRACMELSQHNPLLLLMYVNSKIFKNHFKKST
jgi:hypothetical protein